MAATDAFAAETGARLVHAYDAKPTLAGQGTVALEFLEQSDPDTLLVATGGGGLIGGMAAYCLMDWLRQVRNVLRKEPFVEIDGRIDHVHGFGRAGGETSAPHAVGARRAGGGRRTVLGGILVRLLGGHVGHFRQLALRVVT